MSSQPGLHACDAPYPHWQFTAANGDQLRVVPQRGGLITGWRCGGVERLYFDAERFADPSQSVRGGIPVLFPVCGNVPGNRLRLPQGTFPMAQHGFARDLPWQLTLMPDAAGIQLSLADSDATRAVYPFAFQLQLEVRLEPGALAIQARVAHPGSADPTTGQPAMPFALGLHPYFQVASLAQAQLEGLPHACFDHLKAADASTAHALARLAEGIDLRVDLPAAAEPRLLGAADGSAIAMQLEPPFAHAVVWSDPPRPMVCLEPWSARRGELSLSLAPGQHVELRCRYSVVPPPAAGRGPAAAADQTPA